MWLYSGKRKNNKKDLQRDSQMCTAHAVPFMLFWWGQVQGLVGGPSPNSVEGGGVPVPGPGGGLSSPRSWDPLWTGKLKNITFPHTQCVDGNK